jgi:2-keto-4-pentenoate hydratase
MTGSNATRAAELLAECWRECRQMPDLPVDLLPTGRAEAYAIQDELARLLPFDVAGWKVGMASPASLADAGFDEPIAGRLFVQTLAQSPATFAVDDFISPMVESEFAFRLLDPLPVRVDPYSREEVAAVAVLHLAIEIGDFRITSLLNASGAVPPNLDNPVTNPVQPLPWIADNGGGGGFVVGKEVAEWQHLDLENYPVELRINGELAAPGLKGKSRCDPLGVLQWTANHLSQRRIGLAAGAFVTTGTATRPILVTAGTEAVGHFEDLGEVCVRFSG